MFQIAEEPQGQPGEVVLQGKDFYLQVTTKPEVVKAKKDKVRPYLYYEFWLQQEENPGKTEEE